MDLHPLCVVSVAHISADNLHARSYRWNGYWLMKVGACGDSICLRNGKFAHNLKGQVPALIVHVSGVEQIDKLRIDLKPTMSIAVGFMAHSVCFSAIRCIDDCSCYCKAGLFNDETVCVIDVVPKRVVTMWGGCGFRHIRIEVRVIRGRAGNDVNAS